MKVLVVDGESDFLGQAKASLEKEDDRLEVETIASAEEALDLLEEEDYDAVVSGYQFPEMDGLEFLESIREEIESDIPFIVFTEEGREEVAVEALNLGADRYLRREEDSSLQYGALAQAVVQEIEDRESEKRREFFRISASYAPEGIFISNRDAEVVCTNEQASEELGYSVEELENMKVFDIDPNLSPEDWDEHWEKVRERGEYRIETEHVRKDGTKFPVEVLTNHVTYGGEEYHFTFARSISERKEKERQLRREKVLLDQLLSNIPEMIYFKDKEHRFVRTSKSHAEALGTTREEMIGKTDFDFFPEELAQEMKEDEEQVMRTREPIVEKEEKVPGLKGGERWFSVTKVPRFNEEGEVIGVTGISRDITERKRLQERLDLESNLLNDLLENVPDLIYFKDEDARFVRVSRSKAEEVGKEGREDLYGKTDLDYYSEERAKESYEDDMQVIKTGEPVIQREEKYQTPDGEERWLEATKVPRYDEEGNIIGILGISRDITERKRAEERTEFLHSLLRHDVRNKDQVALGYLDMLADADLSEEEKEVVERAIGALNASNDLIEKVGMLRKIDREKEVGKVQLDEKIRKAVRRNEDVASEEGMEIEYEGVEVEVQGSPLLEECFSNLIENSIKHSGGSLIRITGEEGEDSVRVIVEDDGKGIPDDMKERVFERSYSGESSRGTGMGTYLVKMIAQACEGDATVKDSELGGARFEVTLNKVRES